MMHRSSQPLREIAATPTFRTVDGVSIRFVESDRRDADALLLSPWPESVFAYEPAWYALSDTAREDYLASYQGDRFAESMRYGQSYPAELERLRDVLPHIQTPVQILAGRHDAVVPPVNAEYLHERLPYSEHHLLNSGHFAWEEAADDYASLVTAWWADGYKRCATKSTAVASGS